MPVKVLWNGRQIDPDDITDVVQRAIYKRAAELAQQRVDRIRCSKHHSSATLVLKRASAQGLDFDVEGCCDELGDAIRAAFS